MWDVNSNSRFGVIPVALHSASTFEDEAKRHLLGLVQAFMGIFPQTSLFTFGFAFPPCANSLFGHFE